MPRSPDITALWAGLCGVEQRDVLRALLERVSQAGGPEPLQMLQQFRRPVPPAPLPPRPDPTEPQGPGSAAPRPRFSPALAPRLRALHAQVNGAVAHQRAQRRRAILRRWLAPLAIALTLVFSWGAWFFQQQSSGLAADGQSVEQWLSELDDTAQRLRAKQEELKSDVAETEALATRAASAQAAVQVAQSRLNEEQQAVNEREQRLQRLRPLESQVATAQTAAATLRAEVQKRQEDLAQLRNTVAELETRAKANLKPAAN